jgi:hypothetical protein
MRSCVSSYVTVERPLCGALPCLEIRLSGDPKGRAGAPEFEACRATARGCLRAEIRGIKVTAPLRTGASCHQTHGDYGADAPAVNSASTMLMLKRVERGGVPSASALSAPVDVDAILTDSKKARSTRHSNHFPTKAL